MWTSKRWIVVLAAVSMVTVGVPGMGDSLAGPADAQTTGTDQAPSRPMDVEPAAVDEDAEWRQWRGDFWNTGFSDATADLANPAVVWKHNLGGFVCCNKVGLADLDDDGEEEAVLAIAGNAVARDPATGETLWTSGILGIRAIQAVEDLDQDGTVEVLATSGDTLYLFEGATGERLWETQVAPSRAYVRVADLDPTSEALEMAFLDGGENANNVTAFTFADGADQPTRLWDADVSTLRFQPQNSALYTAEVGGTLRVVYNAWTCCHPTLPSGHHLFVFEGETGDLLERFRYRSSLMQGGPANHVVDIDDDGQNELVLTHDNQKYASAWEWDEAQTTWENIWDWSWSPDRVQFDGVHDLGSDGPPVLLADVLNENGDDAWHLQAWDPTGDGAGDRQILDDVIHRRATGVADTDGDGNNEVLAQDTGPDKPALVAFDWTNEDLDRRWRLNLDVSATGAVQDIDDDGRNEVYLWTEEGRLEALHDEGIDDASLVEKYEHEAAELVEAVGQEHEAIEQGQAVVSQRDGRLVWLDSAFQPTGEEVEASNAATVPLIAPLEPGGPAMVVGRNSQGELEASDPTGVNPGGDPGVDWTFEAYNGHHPKTIVDPRADGHRYQLAIKNDGDPGGPQLLALDADGDSAWQKRFADLGATGWLMNRMTVGDFQGDSGEDVFVSGHDGIGASHGFAVDGSTGEILWATGPIEDANRWPLRPAFREPAAHDYTGDGIDDVVVPNNRANQRMELRDGATGDLLATEHAPWGHDTALGDATGDPQPEAFGSQSGVPSMFELSSDAIEMAWEHRGLRDRLPVLTDVDGDGGVDPVIKDRLEASRVGALDGATGELIWDRFLAGGQVYENESGIPKDAFRGGAKPWTGAATLAGAEGSVVFASSADGHLYGVEARDGSAVWAFDLGFPLGQQALADLDEDGKVELVVSAGDGNLYALDHDPDAPTIEITRPIDRHVYLNDTDLMTVPEPVPTLPPVAVGPVNVTIEAHDQTSGIDRVEIYVDGDLRETIDGPEVGTGGEFEWRWEPSWNETGLHNVTAVAYDRALFAHDTTTSQQVIVVSTDVDGLIQDVNATITRLLDDPRGFVNDTLDQLPDDAPTASTVPAPGLALPGGAAPDVALTVPAMPRASTPAGPGDRGHLATPP